MPSTHEKVALVTGAAGILAPSICLALKEAGWKVAAMDLKSQFEKDEKVRRRPFPAALKIEGDLTKRADAIRIVEEARALGPISLIVHGATGSTTHPFAEITEETCEKIMRIDLLAPIYIAQAATPDLAKTRGLIVHISSAMVDFPVPEFLVYTVAKAGVEKLVEMLAITLAPQGIRVNGIRPGYVPGDFYLRGAMALLPPDLAAQLVEDMLPRQVKTVTKASLIGGASLGSDVAGMILHLVSTPGEMVNATTLSVDGGFPFSKWENFERPYLIAWQENPREKLEEWLKEKGIDYKIPAEPLVK